jgi:cell wall-associated NlpC family hydrolase
VSAPSALPDRRRHPWRPDLAAEPLAGRVPAARFVPGQPRQVKVGVAALKEQPAADARQASQLLFGEAFTVYEQRDGWCWGQNAADGYVGYAPESALGPPGPAPSHRVRALRSFVFPGPDLKDPPLDCLALTSTVRVIGEERGYAALAGGGWIHARSLAPLDHREPDPVATALRLLEVPYLWGGRSPLGIDCSGLVQIALAAAGIAAPRDSDMQRGETGSLIASDCPDGRGIGYRRGDLVFFPGHVGLMLDPERLVHATAHAMAVTIEPLAAVIGRTDPTRGGGLLAVRRLDGTT